RCRHDERDVGLERSLGAELDRRSSSGLASWAAAEHTSSSQRAARNEVLLRPIDAPAERPPASRGVVAREHAPGRKLQQVAARTDRTVTGWPRCCVAAWLERMSDIEVGDPAVFEGVDLSIEGLLTTSGLATCRARGFAWRARDR